MKKLTLTSSLTVAAACMFLATAAQASSTSMIHTAQAHLSNLGYDVGSTDGVNGVMTSNAISDFQSRAGLPVTGILTTQTYDTIAQADYDAHRGYAANGYRYWNDRFAVGYNGYGYNNRYVAPYNNTVAWQNHSQNVPIRFGNLTINETAHDSVRDYAVMLNGQLVLHADNQPSNLHVSNTYTNNGEDAVVFTAYDASGTCNYKNYVLTVHSDGTYNAPRELANCSNQAGLDIYNNPIRANYTTYDNGVRYLSRL